MSKNFKVGSILRYKYKDIRGFIVYKIVQVKLDYYEVYILFDSDTSNNWTNKTRDFPNNSSFIFEAIPETKLMRLIYD